MTIRGLYLPYGHTCDAQAIDEYISAVLEQHRLKKEERIDKIARQKIESQTRPIPEGSEEWDILYRKYYEEELQGLTGATARPDSV